MTILCHYRRTSGDYDKSELTPRQKERGLLMQRKQMFKEGPGCNQLLLSAFVHIPKQYRRISLYIA